MIKLLSAELREDTECKLKEFEKEVCRLQELVCELLSTSQKLRFQIASMVQPDNDTAEDPIRSPGWFT